MRRTWPAKVYLLMAVGWFAFAVAGASIGATATAHRIAWLNTIALFMCGGGFAGLVACVVKAVRIATSARVMRKWMEDRPGR
jgi:FtsH-binding integral membrane protein